VTKAPTLDEQLQASCEASGVPLTVEDPGTLRRVLGLLLSPSRHPVVHDDPVQAERAAS
jgi:hypothetical protein